MAISTHNIINNYDLLAYERKNMTNARNRFDTVEFIYIQIVIKLLLNKSKQN